MPCYDPPPSYEKAYRRNAEQAVQLLCGLITPRVRNGDTTLSSDLLRWFIEHRRIDVEIETDEAARCARYPSLDVLDQAMDDIALAGRQLAAQEQADG